MARLTKAVADGVTLQMSVSPARAQAAVLHLDDDVAAFRAVAVTPLDDRPVDDDPTADSRTQREHHQAVVDPCPRPSSTRRKRLRWRRFEGQSAS